MSDVASIVDGLDDGTFVLRGLDIYNWGPFGGRHHLEIDPGGTAIIGQTGSGKTTLVDALMTLIVAQPRYNLASTGGHESDRDLMSYIRGVTGAGSEAGNDRNVARPGKTATALGATLRNASQIVQLGAIFWIDGTSRASADRKDLWIFCERDSPAFDEWLTVHHDGGARALKQLGRDTPRLHVFDTRRAYLTHIRRFFEVGDNAFTLLNRAAGLKQLNSIDEIFRELVLDDHSAFDRATEVASEFDDLSAIHAELELARQQQASLAPIEPTHRDFEQKQIEAQEVRQLLDILPRWYAAASCRRWSQKLAQIESEQASIAERITDGEQELEGARRDAEARHEHYMRAGGGQIEQMREQIETLQGIVADRRRNAGEYTQIAERLGLEGAIDREQFAANQRWAESEAERQASLHEELENETYATAATRQRHEETVSELEEELASVRARPDSNIPGRYQDFRAELAAALRTSTDALPFVAELVEVKAEESAWRGAIERAIGAHRLRILTPSNHVQAALDWINARDNRLHVRLFDAKAPDRLPDFMADGFTRKLNFKAHALRDPMKALLAGIDRHCVASPDALRNTPHGMTAEGLMSGSRGQYEKRDQEPLGKGWLTGFTNADRVATLEQELAEARRELTDSGRIFDAARQKARDAAQRLELIRMLTQIRFEAIDEAGAQAQLQRLEQRLADLSDPASDAGQAKARYEEARAAQQDIEDRVRTCERELAVLDERYRQASHKQQQAAERMGDGVSEQDEALALRRLPVLDEVDAESLDQHERDAREHLARDSSAIQQSLSAQAQKLVRLMEGAQKIDNGALVEVGTELVDVPGYLARLRVLNEEALPEKLSRFKRYLNQSSDQGVTQLLADVDNEVSIIEERIGELNETLRKVDFQEGRYVQLAPRRVVHESLRTLTRAKQHLRTASLADDEGEAQYRALEQLVALLRDAADNKRTLGARALLDPRYRLQFSYSVMDRATGEIIETRTGSQGGSGGEKEIIASYILTASLSYALCPDGAERPLFGTIVLDEAFSKSSQAVAGRIISALEEFGLHAVFVTPNKEMRLLREHTRSAVLVHRKEMQATLTSIGWEALEAHRRERLRQAGEAS